MLTSECQHMCVTFEANGCLHVQRVGQRGARTACRAVGRPLDKIYVLPSTISSCAGAVPGPPGAPGMVVGAVRAFLGLADLCPVEGARLPRPHHKGHHHPCWQSGMLGALRSPSAQHLMLHLDAVLLFCHRPPLLA